jgi:hypothetical protein
MNKSMVVKELKILALAERFQEMAEKLRYYFNDLNDEKYGDSIYSVLEGAFPRNKNDLYDNYELLNRNIEELNEYQYYYSKDIVKDNQNFTIVEELTVDNAIVIINNLKYNLKISR